ncbi:MAG TPA: hypothetical protein PKD84_09975 [Propionicimonas sp.]|nr:hypothetical protein [Propionicimonas sp.]
MTAEESTPQSTSTADGGQATTGNVEDSSTRQRSVIEVFTVVILSTVAILTAWCGFEASKWGGEMSIAFSQASSARIQATNADGTARDARMFDLVIWANYVQAVANDQPKLQAYIESRFTPAFAKAFTAWKDGGRVESSPFANPAYVPEGTLKAAELNATADAKFAQALENNQRGDNYSLLTVLFALVLFLAAVAQRSRTVKGSWALLGLAITVALVGAAIMFSFPIKI